MQGEPINKEMVFVNQELTTKQDILSFLSGKAKELGLVEDIEDFLESVNQREEMASTSIGYKVAIPHGICDSVNQAFIGFVQVKDEFSWNTDEDQKVKIIFLIGVPKDNKNNIHLKFISQLSRKLMDDEYREKLIEALDRDFAFQTLDEINKKV